MKELKEFWNQRYRDGGISGYGSYGEQLDKKLNWLKGLEIESISEIGCGDFNFGRRLLGLYPNATYYGNDISEFIIERNKTLYPYANFLTTDEPLPSGDLLLCVDVLFHIKDEKDVEGTLNALAKFQTKYLALTAYERNQTEGLSPHVFIRKFDPQRFGTPLIREIVEDDGQLYFYLWRK